MSTNWQADMSSLASPERVPSPTQLLPDTWRIAAKQFSSFRGCFIITNVSDNVSPSGYWTAVDVGRLFNALRLPSGFPWDNEPTRTSYAALYSTLRYVLATAGLLASSDVAKWVQFLHDTLGVNVPAGLDHEGQDCGFAHRFIIAPWTQDGTTGQKVACEHLPCLFDDENPVTTTSEQRWRDLFNRIKTMAKVPGSQSDEEGCSPLEVWIKPTFNQFGHASVEMQTRCIRSATGRILHSMGLQGRLQTDGIKIRLTCVDLDLSLFHVHESVFKEITRLLEKGVVVNELELPRAVTQVHVRNGFDAKLREAWAVLVCTLCGQPPSGSTVENPGVGSLVLSAAHTTLDDFFVPFFSALHNSQGLRRLKIDFSTHRYANVAVARSFWSWLSFALFSSTSTSSIENLDLKAVVLTPSLLNTVQEIVDSDFPAEKLYQAVSGGARPTLPPRSVVINIGMEIKVLRVRRGSCQCRLPSVWTGAVVDDGVASADITVLLPGFGFCVFEDSYTNKIKRSRIDQAENHSVVVPARFASCLHTLSLDSGLVEPSSVGANHVQCDMLARLVQLIGNGVTSLNLGKYTTMSDDALGACLAACPQLKHLRVDGSGEYSPTRCFSQAYARGSSISSVNFAHLPESFVDFESFLQLLIADGPTQTTLKKLQLARLPRHWDEGTVLSLLVHILQDRRSLREVRVALRSDAGRVSKTQLAAFHGQIVPTGPLPLQHRLAFVSCQSRDENLSDNGVGCLDQDTNALVFAFAAPTTKRVVVVET